MLDATLTSPLPLETDAAVESPGRRALRRLVRRRGAMVGFAVLACFVLLAVAAPWVTPYDPIAQSWMTVRKAPSAPTRSAATFSPASSSAPALR
jgi:peptide/nickel transport system permease protein